MAAREQEMSEHEHGGTKPGGRSSPRKRNVSCPNCGKLSIYSELNAFRPFCSENCKTGDLAAWASDEYRLPTKEPVHSNPDERTSEDNYEDI